MFGQIASYAYYYVCTNMYAHVWIEKYTHVYHCVGKYVCTNTYMYEHVCGYLMYISFKSIRTS